MWNFFQGDHAMDLLLDNFGRQYIYNFFTSY